MVRRARSKYSDYVARCPMLGHLVQFAYCTAPGTKLPCRRILDCWHERMDIESFVRETFTSEEIKTLFAPPKQKLIQIIELAKKAKENK